MYCNFLLFNSCPSPTLIPIYRASLETNFDIFNLTKQTHLAMKGVSFFYVYCINTQWQLLEQSCLFFKRWTNPLKSRRQTAYYHDRLHMIWSYKSQLYLCTGTASVTIKHTQQHSSCLQACGGTATVFYWSVGWQLITLKTHHWWQILAIKLWHLERWHKCRKMLNVETEWKLTGKSVFSMCERPSKPWSCTRWLSEWSWPAAEWGSSCGALRLSGNILSAADSATNGTAALRKVGEWWALTGTGVVGMVTDWRQGPWHEANPWGAVMLHAWLTEHCRHTNTALTFIHPPLMSRHTEFKGTAVKAAVQLYVL